MKIIQIVILFSCFLFTLSVNGQNLRYYQNKKNSNQKSIKFSKKILAELKKTNKNKLDQLLLIKNEIAKRKSNIVIINNELRLITEQVEKENIKLKNLYFQLENQKNEYSKLIYYAYLNISVQNRMIYILSASSFANAYKRIVYIKQLADFRKFKYKMLASSINKIDSTIVLLNEKEIEKRSLVSDKTMERDSLLLINKELRKATNALGVEIDKFNIKVTNTEKKKKLANSNIKNEISKNIENKNDYSEYKTDKARNGNGKDFAKYKRQHLWPLKDFVLLHKFGNYAHPVLKDITLKNDGIELGASPNSNVFAIYKGKVVNIMSIPGDGHSIIIKHGEYFSVYSKVGKVYIKKGQIVSRGERIAKLRNNSKLEKLIFQIWKGKTKLNPQKWLKRK